MRTITLLGLLLSLQGCSLNHDAAPSISITPELAASDDATCRSFGLDVGTDTYAKCRLQMEHERQSGPVFAH